jgi:hypothetical protein
MKKLSNHTLLKAYERAYEIRLNEDFIQLLRTEIFNRGMENLIERTSSELNLELPKPLFKK